MNIAGDVSQSETLTVVLAVLNVVQTVWLADIAARARRVRRQDAPKRRRPRGENHSQ